MRGGRRSRRSLAIEPAIGHKQQARAIASLVRLSKSFRLCRYASFAMAAASSFGWSTITSCPLGSLITSQPGAPVYFLAK